MLNRVLNTFLWRLVLMASLEISLGSMKHKSQRWSIEAAQNEKNYAYIIGVFLRIFSFVDRYFYKQLKIKKHLLDMINILYVKCHFVTLVENWVPLKAFSTKLPDMKAVVQLYENCNSLNSSWCNPMTTLFISSKKGILPECLFIHRNLSLLIQFKLVQSSRPEVFLIRSMRHGLWQGCSPVNLLHIFRTSFPKSTSRWLLLLVETKYLVYASRWTCQSAN